MFKIYNTLSRKKEVFRPRKNKKVNIFVCGPTVYDLSHLGHARTYIFYDMLVGYLKFLGYKVFYLQNITDIDDKIIKRAKEKKKGWQEIARTFEKEYLKDMRALKIVSVTKYARATEYIKEIQSQVKRLLKQGFAYQTKDGIYYDIKKFKDYGKLSKRTAQQAQDATSRIDQAKKKKNKGDFCLWKKSKPNEPKWPSPWFWGRPGWHIEDTAISEKYLGVQYDIHGGARELIFPHHEAEIAQMEAISGKSPLVKYWVHAGILKINGKKMAKSLGNFVTVRDFLKKNSPEVLRFIVFSAHYSSPLNYSQKLVKESERNLGKLEEFLRQLREKSKPKNKSKSSLWKLNLNKTLIGGFEKRFFSALNDDFNTPKVKGLIFDFLAKINKKIDKGKISSKEAKEIYNFFKKQNKIFGFLNFKKIEKKEVLPQQIKKLVKEREKLRTQKKWKSADEIRKKIQKLGYQIEDTKKGPRVKKLTNSLLFCNIKMYARGIVRKIAASKY
ncbi:MAG: cysteine--tRNA ligase [Patescibacteria group bacterium]|nr:cysteine--tRNA ligase [Patescibacteria group bacterium]